MKTPDFTELENKFLNNQKPKTMSIIAKSGGTLNPCPEGTHVAICYRMIDIGTIKEEYLGEAKMQHKVQLTFETPFETFVFHEEKGPQPYVVSKEYTLSMHEKSTLRKDLESWRGKAFTEEEAKGFDVTKLIGQACQITVTHNDKGYAQVKAISGLAKGMSKPLPTNPQVILDYDNFDWDVFNSLPDFIKNKIASSKEYKALNEEAENKESLKNEAPQEIGGGDLPF